MSKRVGWRYLSPVPDVSSVLCGKYRDLAFATAVEMSHYKTVSRERYAFSRSASLFRECAPSLCLVS